MKLILLIINCIHSGESIDIANPTFSSYPNRCERRRLAAVAKAKRPEHETRSHPSCTVRVFALLAFLLLLARTLDNVGQVADCIENNISKYPNTISRTRA
jgi:hypothetical protein